MTLNTINNEKGVSYCVTVYDKKNKSFHNEYVSYAEYLILKEAFEKLGYKVLVKDFR